MERRARIKRRAITYDIRKNNDRIISLDGDIILNSS